MERLALYLDDLEDLIYAVALKMERIRKAVFLGVLLLFSFTLQFLGILLALSRPPLALAVVSLTVVGMLYRGVTSGFQQQHLSS